MKRLKVQENKYSWQNALFVILLGGFIFAIYKLELQLLLVVFIGPILLIILIAWIYVKFLSKSNYVIYDSNGFIKYKIGKHRGPTIWFEHMYKISLHDSHISFEENIKKIGRKPKIYEHTFDLTPYYPADKKALKAVLTKHCKEEQFVQKADNLLQDHLIHDYE